MCTLKGANGVHTACSLMEIIHICFEIFSLIFVVEISAGNFIYISTQPSKISEVISIC